MNCPFSDPLYDIPVDKPCPVCGALGFNPKEVEAKCVDSSEQVVIEEL